MKRLNGSRLARQSLVNSAASSAVQPVEPERLCESPRQQRCPVRTVQSDSQSTRIRSSGDRHTVRLCAASISGDEAGAAGRSSGKWQSMRIASGLRARADTGHAAQKPQSALCRPRESCRTIRCHCDETAVKPVPDRSGQEQGRSGCRRRRDSGVPPGRPMPEPADLHHTQCVCRLPQLPDWQPSPRQAVWCMHAT